MTVRQIEKPTRVRSTPVPFKPLSTPSEAQRFDTSGAPRLVEIGHSIHDLKREADCLLHDIQDVWAPLGRRAPLLREAFSGVELPVTSAYQLIDEMGGEDRVIVAPSLDGSLMAVSVLDMVESLRDFLEEVLPVTDWEVLAHEILSREVRFKKGKTGGRKLLRGMGSKHLEEIMACPERQLRAFPDRKPRPFTEAFVQKRPAYELLTKRSDGKATTLYRSLAAHSGSFKWIEFSFIQQLLDLLSQASLDGDKQADIVFAKTNSANSYLNNVEQALNQASGYIDNVLSAGSLTTTILNYNSMAQNSLDSATQLLAQAIADLASAEAAAQQIPGNSEAQAAVVESQVKLEQVQNQVQQVIQKMAEAEAYKDVLAIPQVCLQIRCIEEDPCCDDDWNGVNVRVSNTSNPDVPDALGTTSGNGSVTLCGRFGDSAVVVTSTGPGSWNETRFYNVGDQSASYTIKTDLPGFE